MRDGEVVGDALAPSEFQWTGYTLPLRGAAHAAALAEWEALRGCTGLTAAPAG